MEADIKEFTALKVDKRFHVILNILRHCRRLSEVRGGGLTRYVITWGSCELLNQPTVGYRGYSHNCLTCNFFIYNFFSFFTFFFVSYKNKTLKKGKYRINQQILRKQNIKCLLIWFQIPYCKVAFMALPLESLQYQKWILKIMIKYNWNIVFLSNYISVWPWIFFIFFFFLRAAPMPYGGSQARGPTGAIAVGLRHSHSNTGSELHLWTPLEFVAMPDPGYTEQGQGSNPQPHGA